MPLVVQLPLICTPLDHCCANTALLHELNSTSNFPVFRHTELLEAVIQKVH